MPPGEPIDPKNGRIGDPRFGHWEDVTQPYKPWVGDTPPPLTTAEATPYTRVIDSAAGPTQQRWVQYTYEVAHSRQVSLGGDVQVKGQAWRYRGSGPLPVAVGGLDPDLHRRHRQTLGDQPQD